MKTTKHNQRNLALALVALFSVTMLTSGGALGQTQALQCPNPRHITLTQSSGAATPVLANFPQGPCSAGFEPNFNGTKPDRCFRHTFSFPPPTEMCCQCVEGKGTSLTIVYKALFGGPPKTSSSANDTLTIYSNGSAVFSQSLYSGTVVTGQVGTKTIPLKCSWLANNELNMIVQDDSAINSATLNVNTCCVRK